MSAQSHEVRLVDYQPPPWQVNDIDLLFDLDVDVTEVESTLHVQRNADSNDSLRLLGTGLELLELHLDGRRLSALEYVHANGALSIPGARDGSVIRIRVRVDPANNSALEGLYLSGSREAGFLLTQCEAEGFRRITFFPDRPDVLTRYSVTLRADRQRFPVLLAGGNPDGEGDLPDGRHWARFVDPHPRPSYLFALVAGHLSAIEERFSTAEGRAVTIKMWAEADNIERCRFAMGALLRAMRWDEQAYGRCYDLDVLHVVATDDFTMGAMENKGLNIFNAKYLLADPDSSTDSDYRHVESVIGHEYFHNWSGNRVTCRDWFQLSLKEGFTVYREQSFAAATNSPALQRIDDVTRLRRAQFPEDAGPLAHPVRPQSYQEIGNFYTATVYEKGAELVRMLAGRLGDDAFRRGTDLYFARHDGSAVTIEDFLAALGDANELDLGAYLGWYQQAGTPTLHADGSYDTDAQTFTLTLSQHTEPTPGQMHKQVLPIPLALALFDADGSVLPLHAPDVGIQHKTACVVEMTDAAQTLHFKQVARRPVVSLLRGFSAPVVLESNASDDDLALLLRHEPDGFNRWQAGQQLATRAFTRSFDAGELADQGALGAWCNALRDPLANVAFDDPALLAALLDAPDEFELGASTEPLDPDAVHATREGLMGSLAMVLGADLLGERYASLHQHERGEPSAAARGVRALKNRVLFLLGYADLAQALKLAASQFDHAACMTDRLAALTVLLHFDGDAAAAKVDAFWLRYANNMLALDKWFAVQASVPRANTLARVEALLHDSAFSLRNPNRVHALLGSFMRNNAVGFHRTDGASYRLACAKIGEIDASIPQLAARLATALEDWRRLEPVRKSALHDALGELAGAQNNSVALNEILERILKPVNQSG